MGMEGRPPECDARVPAPEELPGWLVKEPHAPLVARLVGDGRPQGSPRSLQHSSAMRSSNQRVAGPCLLYKSDAADE